MFRMLARRRAMIEVTAGADVVMFGMTLPSDSIIDDIKATITLHNNGSVFSVKNDVLMYGFEGWILPLLDPDSAINFNTLWDNLVPKDTDTEVLDLDTGAADATPFFEPGEIDWTTVLDVGLRPRKIYGRYKMLSWTNAAHKIQDAATPFASEWTAGDMFNIRIRKKMHIRQPSVLVFALASPSMDDTTATVETALAEPQLSQVKYMEETLERAHLHLIGLTEATAETPFEEATALIKTHLEPDVFEGNADNFVAVGYQAQGELFVGHRVKGRLGKSMLTTGR